MPISLQHAWPLEVTELRPALRLVVELAKADMGVLMLHDASSDMLFPVVAHGMTDTQCTLFGPYRANDGPFGRAMSEHRQVRIRNVWSDPQVPHDAAHSLGFRHLEILPFFHRDGHVLGVFCVIFRNGHGSRRHAVRLEAYCADVVATALSHALEHAESESARQRMASASQAKTQFFARMSHELRTPLQSITGYVDLLRTGTVEPVKPAQARMLSRIAESERLLVHVIDDLITYSRLEAGHVTYSIRAVSAFDALCTTEAVVAPLAADHRVRLDVTPCPENLLVRADSDKLKQILVNLTANAIKFTPPGGSIAVTCRNDADSVSFDVTDTGAGIARDKLRDIFEPYVQVGAPMVDNFGGSGLGLAISREFASAMAGSLSVTSEVGRGSVFTLRLPRDKGMPASTAVAGVETPAPPPS